jgi:hypothetical protein
MGDDIPQSPDDGYRTMHRIVASSRLQQQRSDSCPSHALRLSRSILLATPAWGVTSLRLRCS